MKKWLFNTILILFLIISSFCFGSGLQTSFEGSNFSGLVRSSTILEYRGIVDSSNNLIDFSGNNLLSNRSEFNNWTQSGTCAVTINVYRNPVDGVVNADLLDNTSGVNTDARYTYSTSSAGTHTGSIWVRSDTPHIITIILYEQAIGIINEVKVLTTNSWKRVSVSGSGTGVGTIGFWVYPGERGVSTGVAYFYGAHLIQNDSWRTERGIFLNPADTTINKPNHDLASTGNPTMAVTNLQGLDGNKLDSRFFDNTPRYYSKAHHDSMNIFDTDHTITQLLLITSGISWDALSFSHGLYQADGVFVQRLNATGQIVVYYNKSGVAVSTGISFSADQYHILQIVRSNNLCKIGVDGIFSNPIDCTGYGIDGSRNLLMSTVGVNSWLGDISYTRIDAEALSDSELAYQRDYLLGAAAKINFKNPSWDFARTTTATKEFSNGTLKNTAVNVPRVSGKGGGILLEGPSVNMLLRSEEFNLIWITTNASIVSNTDNSPFEELTADTLHEDATPAQTHYVSQGSINVVSGTKYTFSAFIKQKNRTWTSLLISQSGVDPSAYFNLTKGTVGTLSATTSAGIVKYANEYNRCSITWIAPATESVNVLIYVAEGDNDVTFNGLNQDSLYLFGGQMEYLSLPSSYIRTTTIAVGRTSDDLTMDPHKINTNNVVIPEIFCPTCLANKLTIYFEFKCQWDGSTTAGSSKVFFEISGNTGTASETRNRIRIWYDLSNTRLEFQFRDNFDIDHEMRNATAYNYSEWMSTRIIVDFSDLSRMDLWMRDDMSKLESNAATTYNGNSGIATFDTTGTKIRLGQNYINSSSWSAHCWIRNLRIYNNEVRAP